MINYKKYIIPSLTLIIIILGWLFLPSKNNQKFINEINNIQRERDSLERNIDTLQSNYNMILSSDSIKNEEVIKINQNLINLEKNLNESNNKVVNLKTIIDSLNKKIKDTTQINRVGDDLLNSLKSKLN